MNNKSYIAKICFTTLLLFWIVLFTYNLIIFAINYLGYKLFDTLPYLNIPLLAISLIGVISSLLPIICLHLNSLISNKGRHTIKRLSWFFCIAQNVSFYLLFILVLITQIDNSLIHVFTLDIRKIVSLILFFLMAISFLVATVIFIIMGITAAKGRDDDNHDETNKKEIKPQNKFTSLSSKRILLIIFIVLFSIYVLLNVLPLGAYILLTSNLDVGEKVPYAMLGYIAGSLVLVFVSGAITSWLTMIFSIFNLNCNLISKKGKVVKALAVFFCTITNLMFYFFIISFIILSFVFIRVELRLILSTIFIGVYFISFIGLIIILGIWGLFLKSKKSVFLQECLNE